MFILSKFNCIKDQGCSRESNGTFGTERERTFKRKIQFDITYDFYKNLSAEGFSGSVEHAKIINS